MFTITKSYRDLPAAHRQPKHDGHCSLVHGHNWGFDITISCLDLDENGFVLDVGKMKEVKGYLELMFDHTCLINMDDPQMKLFEQMHLDKLIDLRVVSNCGMEKLAEMVASQVHSILVREYGTERGVRVDSVTCLEDAKNVSTYTA